MRKLSLAMSSLAILLLIILLLASAACNGGSPESTPTPSVTSAIGKTPTPTPPSSVTATPAPPPIEVKATPSQTTYLPGETITIEFSVKNTGAEPLTIRSGPPEFEVRSMESHRHVRVFPQGREQVTLATGETVTYTFVWDQRDDSGQQALPGEYRVASLHYFALGEGLVDGWESPTRRVMAGTVRVLIEYHQGAMEKSIEVDQSQTASGLTITLERVELSAAGGEVYAFTTPSNFDPSQGPPGPPPQSMIAPAQYSVDGGPVRDAGYGGSTIHEDGMELFWRDLDPIPSDAEVLTFTITDVELLFAPTGPSQWPGPWEFEIPLQ